MQKQRSATPFDGVGIGGDGDAANLDVPDISVALRLLAEADRENARSLHGVAGRWKACPCGLYDCPSAEFIPD